MVTIERTTPRRDRWSAVVAADFVLIAKAITDALRALAPSRPESRWSKLRHCGCSF